MRRKDAFKLSNNYIASIYSMNPFFWEVPMAFVQEVSDQSFNETVIHSTRPAVVDFWAPWCMPCRMLAPILEKVAEKNAGKVDIYKLNTDQNPQMSAKFHVMSIPCVVFFKNGQEVRRVIGVQQEGVFQREIDQL